MEWQVVTVIIALVALGAAVVKPIISLTQSITKLTVFVERLQSDVEAWTGKNSNAHVRLWEHNDGQDSQLADHEHRIGALEEK